MNPFLPSWCLSGCPNGPFQSVLGSRPWSPPQDVLRTGPFAIEIVLKVRQNPAPFQNRNSIGNPVLQVSLVPPWCLPGCPNGSFLPPWCLPGASQAVQLILSCLPGASIGCPNGSFLPPWCLAGCPIDPFLPFWRLASCSNGSFLPLWCLPGASQAGQLILSCLPGASESWSFPASLVPLCQREFKAAGRGAHPRICREPGRSPLKLY